MLHRKMIGFRVTPVRAAAVLSVSGAALSLLASGLPASAAQSAIRRPAIEYFRASPTSLPAAGGNVQLSTSVRRASTCTFTSSPALGGLPAKVSCSSGVVKHTVRVPANHTAGKKAYKFGLTVKGSGGTTTASPVTVVEREAPPAIAKIAVQPADLPSAGGATVLSAMVSRSKSCTVSAIPAVAGLPVTTPCVAGSVPARVSVPFTLPALAGATAQKYSLTLAVTGPGGTSKASAASTVWPAMTFSSPTRADVPAGWIGAVSCVSATFCMGMDLADGSAERWNGSGWSAPVRLETGPYLDSGYSINVSCVSSSFCLAVDASGNAFAYDGTSWSSSTPKAPLDAVSLSCASATFCIAVDAHQATIFNGTSWSAPVTVDAPGLIRSVSCASESFCMAVDGQQAFTYTQSGWGTPTLISMTTLLVQVSCASSTLCAAIGRFGQAFLYNGSWSSATTLSANSMDSVSCPRGASFCMALSNGSYYTTDGVSWTKATSLDPGKPSVLSCASATYCMVTDGTTIFVFNGTSSWAQSAVPRGPLHGFTYSVSCPKPSFCLAVDWYGAYLIYNGKSWSAPQRISPSARAVDSVSCTSPTFCLAVDATTSNGQGGHVFSFDGSKWTDRGQTGFPLSSVSCSGPSFCEMLSFTSNGSVYADTWKGSIGGPSGFVDSYVGFGPQPGEGFVSCATATFCVAVDHLGNAFTFNGSAWSKPTALVPGFTATMDAISCPTTTFCVAIDAGGNEYTFNGSSWTPQTNIDNAGTAQTISCTASHFCLMADLSGNVATFNGATWSTISNIDPVATAGTGLTGVSCADAADCVLVDWEGNALVGTG